MGHTHLLQFLSGAVTNFIAPQFRIAEACSDWVRRIAPPEV